MPGRSGYSTLGGWAGGGVSSAGLPNNLSLDRRIDSEPLEYKAAQGIEFTGSFESGSGDGFEAYITTESGTGGGSVNGTDGAEGLYRYGFNGKENDNEVKGEGNQQDYGMRIYDTRLGRFLSVDPITAGYPYYTPYQFAGNMPVWAIDLDGLEPLPFQEWERGGWSSSDNFKLIKGSKNHVKVVTFGDIHGTGHNYIAIRDQKIKGKWWYATYKNQVGSLGNAQKGDYRLYNPDISNYEQWTPEGFSSDDAQIKLSGKHLGEFGEFTENVIVSSVIIGSTGGMGKVGWVARLGLNAYKEFGVNGQEADLADIGLGSLPGMGGFIGVGTGGFLDFSPFSSDPLNRKFSSPIFPNTGATTNKSLKKTMIDLVTGSAYKGVEFLPKKTIKGLTKTQIGTIEISSDVSEKIINKIMQDGAHKTEGDQ